ncbi:glycosyltransferase [Streptomyces sp. ODS28]|uniref:glycosyltransferase n=1 Tax=Streptomyces sp. ODS28 TaxID=3136688 RepID=UPI0031EB2A9B
MPTRNEAPNVGPLLHALGDALRDAPWGAAEILFVDDSTDGTPGAIERAAAGCPVPVTVHHREAPAGGLGGAVVEGFARTSAPWVAVMDADLQHPPELLPELIRTGERTGAELVVASRYAAGGSSGGLSCACRTAVSRTSTALVKALFPGALRGISDPLSGFFAVRREALARAAGRDTRGQGPGGGGLRPLGYKVLLELAVRCRPRTVTEVPYAFGARLAGESKSSVQEGLLFLRHVLRLRTGTTRTRMLAFGLIGLSGLLPNLLMLKLLIAQGVHYLPAEVVANQAGVLWNFLLLEGLLYRGRRPGTKAARLLGFAVVSNADLVGRIPLMALLVAGLRMPPTGATAMALVVVFAVRFLCVDRFIYRRSGRIRALLPRAEAADARGTGGAGTVSGPPRPARTRLRDGRR